MSQLAKKEKVRQTLIRLIFVVYWMLIFEGAIRKWAFPQFQKILFFMRDPVVLWIYYLCWKHSMLPKWRGWFKTFGILSIALAVLALTQTIFLGADPLIAIYGWRNYCFYVPLAFIIAEQFQEVDLMRLIRHTLIVSVPIAVLVFVQFKSGPNSFINRTYIEDAHVFTVTGDIVRTTGTFTFSAGQALFVGSVVAMCAAAWLSTKRIMKLPLLLVTSGAVLTNLAVCGSRSAYFLSALAFGAAMAFAVVTKNKVAQIKTLIVAPLILATAAVLFMTVFSTAYHAILERNEAAEANEGSMFLRAARIMSSSFDVLPELTVLGEGLGAGTTGAGAISSARNIEAHENEGARVIQESGVLGILYMGARVWLAGYLVWRSIIATRRSGSPIPVMLAAFAAVLIGFAQVTLQGTTNGYGWLFLGFSLAANKLGSGNQKRPQKLTTAVGAG